MAKDGQSTGALLQYVGYLIKVASMGHHFFYRNLWSNMTQSTGNHRPLSDFFSVLTALTWCNSTWERIQPQTSPRHHRYPSQVSIRKRNMTSPMVSPFVGGSIQHLGVPCVAANLPTFAVHALSRTAIVPTTLSPLPHPATHPLRSVWPCPCWVRYYSLLIRYRFAMESWAAAMEVRHVYM